MKKRKFEYYCDNLEDVENYELAKADNFKGWTCHHRLGTHTSDGERRPVDISHIELQALGMYWHRPAEELIFMTESEHKSLHRRGAKREPFSEEWRRNLSNSHIGKEPWNKGIKNVFHWYNNGEKSIRAEECPPGYVPGRIYHRK